MSDLYASNANYQLYSPYAIQSAQDYGVPSSLLLAQIGQESSWNPNAQNGNASGLGQFMPGTWSEFGSGSPTNPYDAIDATAAYDSYLYGQTGNWSTVLQKYGTTANVPSSVTNMFNGIINSLTGNSGSASTGSGAPYGFNTSTGAASGSGSSGTSSGSSSATCSALDLGCWFNTLVGRAGIVVLGLVLIAGALFLFKGGPEINVSAKV
jgi:hypothetical protein